MNTNKTNERLDADLLRLIFVMVLGGMMAILDATIVNVGIGTLAQEFDLSLGSVEWVATAYLLSVAMAIPVAGWAIDRFGAKRIWISALSLFLVGSGLSALAWSLSSLIAFRVVQGFGGGMLEPIMMAVVVKAAGPSRAGRVLAVMSIPINLGPVLGPIIGGLVLRSFPWEWMFLINLPIGLLAIVLASRMLAPDPKAVAGHARFDAIGAVLLSPGFAAIIYGLSQAGLQGFGSSRAIIGISLGTLLIAGYVIHALRTPYEPLIDVRLFRQRSFSASVGVMFLVGAGVYSAMFLLPLFYQQVRNQGVLGAGLLLAPFGLGMLMTMPISGSISDRTGARSIVPLGAVLAAVGSFGFTQVTNETSPWLLGAASVVIGWGIGFIGPPTVASVYQTVSLDRVARATSALFIFIQVGASFGIAISALILQRSKQNGDLAHGFGNAFWWVVVASLLVMVASRSLPGRTARTDSKTSASPIWERVAGD
jgi:EmrB/QacA subfamily drug resistance transporter